MIVLSTIVRGAVEWHGDICAVSLFCASMRRSCTASASEEPWQLYIDHTYRVVLRFLENRKETAFTTIGLILE